MAEMFVMCPDCGLRLKLTRTDAQVADAEGKCKHRTKPANRPTLVGPIAAIRQVLKQPVRPAQ